MLSARIIGTILGMVLGVSACASRSEPPPQPIVVPCHTKEVKRPSFPFDALPLDADIFTQTKTLLADRKERQGYEAKLEAANEACR